jgi:amidase
LADRNRIAREWALFQTQYPLIVGPVATMRPFEVAADVKDKGTLAEIATSFRLITTMNLLGLPSVAAPVQVTDGLPQAVQIIGSRYREDLCLDAAEALEQRVGVFTPIEPH